MIPAYVIVEGIEALPTLPEAVSRITMMMRNDHASVEDFEKAVRHDPAVTANLLRAANSVFYRAIEPVCTIGQAVARIGLKRVFEVAIGTSLRRALPPRIYGYGITAPAFWDHCTATAVYADMLARKAAIRSADNAFTAGLLHDIGKLVIGRFIEELTPESNWWAFGTAAAERELLGTDHCEVGREIAAKWELPALIAQACRWHHDPAADAPGLDKDLAVVIHVADRLSYIAGFPGSGGGCADYNCGALQRLGFTGRDLDLMAEECKDEIIRMSAATSLIAA
jgi:putative nucleotidyltransferase with HDIG domain